MHIVESFGGGVFKYIVEINRALPIDEFQHIIVHSIDPFTPKNYKEYFNENTEFYYINMNKKSNLFKDLRSIVSVRRLIKNTNPDAIHIHSSKAGFIGRLACLNIKNKKQYYTPHGYSFIMTNLNKVKKWIYYTAEYFLTNIGNCSILACSKSEYRYGCKLAFRNHVFLLENGTSMDIDPEYRWNSRMIIGIGRLVEQKSPETFIKVIHGVKKERPDIQAMWIGDGPLKDHCQQLNGDLQTDIKFIGSLSQIEVYKYLKDSTIFLQTSKWEGLPFTILESLALGIPVVASNIESHCDVIVDGENGYIANDLVEYREKIVKMLNDESLANRISYNAVKSHKSLYSIEKFQKGIEELYK